MSQFSLKSSLGGGAGVELGECIPLPDKSNAILTIDDQVFLKSGNLSIGDSALYPDAYKKFLGIATTITMPSATYRAATYGKGLFVAVAYSNYAKFQTSPDGINWTERSTPAAQNYNCIGFNGSLFVALTNKSTGAAYSTDGITWSYSSTAITSGIWRGIAFGNNVWVSTTSSNTTQAARSSNGTTWTDSTLPTAGFWSTVAFGNSIFVTVKESSTVSATTTDGITWTQRALPAGSWSAVSFGGGKFYLTGTTGLMTSTDGITWNVVNVPSSLTGLRLVSQYGSYGVLLAAITGVCFYSTDLVDWISVDTVVCPEVQLPAAGGGRFVVPSYYTSFGLVIENAIGLLAPSVDNDLPLYMRIK